MFMYMICCVNGDDDDVVVRCLLLCMLITRYEIAATDHHPPQILFTRTKQNLQIFKKNQRSPKNGFEEEDGTFAVQSCRNDSQGMLNQ